MCHRSSKEGKEEKQVTPGRTKEERRISEFNSKEVRR
jgi:hypothetical protein